jgi:hypothetical protein
MTQPSKKNDVNGGSVEDVSPSKNTTPVDCEKPWLTTSEQQQQYYDTF